MIKINNVKEFQAILRTINYFVNEGNFRINDKGIFFKSLDPSQVLLLDIKMPKESFISFDVEPMLVGLNIDDLNKIIKRVESNEIIELKFFENSLMINISGSLKRSFSLPLLDLPYDDVELPKIAEKRAKIIIKAKAIKEILKDASLFSSTIIIEINKENAKIISEGTNGVFTVSLNNSRFCNVHAIEKDVKAKFSLSFLENIIKESNDDKDIVMEIANDSPLKISYSIGHSKLDFYLAHMLI